MDKIVKTTVCLGAKQAMKMNPKYEAMMLVTRRNENAVWVKLLQMVKVK